MEKEILIYRKSKIGTGEIFSSSKFSIAILCRRRPNVVKAGEKFCQSRFA